ncbi:MAG: AMP-binding protein, partial [Ktedonobacteraceae bacterium]|nr:AMP-binding protein [Ktedonobacteraceae bacterium]
MESKVYRSELTPVSFLERSALIFPQKTAVVYGDRRYTYSEFAERVYRLASQLRRSGLNKHDRVAFLCPNIPPILEAHFAIPAAGGILVAINTRLNTQEIGFILRHSGAKYLFVDDKLYPLVAPLDLSQLTVVHIADSGDDNDPYEQFLAAGSPEPLESWLEDEEETISINYTSGTTGNPKGVMYSYRGGYLNALGEVIESGIRSDSVYLWTLP